VSGHSICLAMCPVVVQVYGLSLPEVVGFVCDYPVHSVC
jgi:hypothetical protein